MRLASVSVRNFRSILTTELPECSGFNVLIGKNNSGKSNLLSAIDYMLRFFRETQIATVKSFFDRNLDFHNRNAGAGVTLTGQFVMDLEEISGLVQEIEVESPQVRLAVDQLLECRMLKIMLEFSREPQLLALVSEIVLVSPENVNHSLLKVPARAALEIAKREHDVRRFSNEVDALEGLQRRIDESDFRRLRDSTLPLSYLLESRLRKHCRTKPQTIFGDWCNVQTTQRKPLAKLPNLFFGFVPTSKQQPTVRSRLR
jgi:putative ATP-dependent endonuclease of the OLD family